MAAAAAAAAAVVVVVVAADKVFMVSTRRQVRMRCHGTHTYTSSQCRGMGTTTTTATTAAATATTSAATTGPATPGSPGTQIRRRVRHASSECSFRQGCSREGA
jgi:hypothetical protein